MQKLTANGHRKAEILHEYSVPEIQILYEKIIKMELNQRADFIEGVIAGVGGCFGGYKEVEKVIKDLRK